MVNYFGVSSILLPYESLDNVTRTVPVDYLLPPDLFVHRLDRPTMERVVGQLLTNGEMRVEWLCPPETDDGTSPNRGDD